MSPTLEHFNLIKDIQKNYPKSFKVLKKHHEDRDEFIYVHEIFCLGTNLNRVIPLIETTLIYDALESKKIQADFLKIKQVLWKLKKKLVITDIIKSYEEGQLHKELDDITWSWIFDSCKSYEKEFKVFARAKCKRMKEKPRKLSKRR